MKVKELIKILQGKNPEHEVLVQDGDSPEYACPIDGIWHEYYTENDERHDAEVINFSFNSLIELGYEDDEGDDE